ncbi:MAG: flagellar hook-associated protein FlgL [Chromatiaceae bacterium]|nr:flagellar hook-associated protein FlgL [Gammaproteobacteria bacterium]MCP5427276.1 flagellar hook-associated protein FlgL [Chromatiaceae bacterium]MCB1871049.1 flagellar hook-associated protein FlgL [Gammaproteobacteria bacterium]MCB1879673.1 flagellar hook-associated protein FlgL [Gammaproteobacteria bacterium]MCB1902746.1 flagellar hook-associated protein FlgL [Gammaproteobacteria bacterium]
MSRISTSMITQRAIDAMLRQQNKVSNTQQQLSTGRRVLAPSDDPASASRVLGLNRALETVQQYQSNINRAQSRLETEEGVLNGVTNLLQRVSELAVQGNNDTLSATDTKAIAAEVRQLLAQLYSMANTQDSNGEYIFAGYQSGTKPFTNPAVGSYVYNGDLGERQLQISPDRQVADGDNGFALFVNVATAAFAQITAVDATDFTAVADGDITIDGGNGNGPVSIGSIPAAADAAERAQQLADAVNAVSERTGVRAAVNDSGLLELNVVGGSGISVALGTDAGPRSGLSAVTTPTTVAVATATTPRNVFETLHQLVTELESDRPVDRYIDDVHLALDSVINTRTSVGGRLNSIDEQHEVNADLELSLESHRSVEEDLDFAEAIARYERQMTALQAAQQSYVRIKGLSLFDYL